MKFVVIFSLLSHKKRTQAYLNYTVTIILIHLTGKMQKFWVNPVNVKPQKNNPISWYDWKTICIAIQSIQLKNSEYKRILSLYSVSIIRKQNNLENC